MRLLRNKVGGLLAANWVKLWMATLDHQAVMYDRSVDPVGEQFSGRAIFVSWHEYLLLPFYLRGWSHSAILTSQHRDAEWLSEAARHMGFQTIRGSTSRGGSRALLEMVRGASDQNIGIASDGPRGPRRKMAQGPVYLSSRLQIPIVIMAVGFDRPWRMPTWDSFALPRPFSRSRLIMSPRIQLPAELDRDGIEHYRRRLESLLAYLTQAAEAWARAGTRIVDQQAIRPQPVSLRQRRQQSERAEAEMSAKSGAIFAALPVVSAPALPGRFDVPRAARVA
jgi:lysophospholipid acyltransferase (LPLAT)-like uncharacterized protein